jgi:hypothetical protein
MAISGGTVDDELAHSINRRVNLVNKALKQNGLNKFMRLTLTQAVATNVPHDASYAVALIAGIV